MMSHSLSDDIKHTIAAPLKQTGKIEEKISDGPIQSEAPLELDSVSHNVGVFPISHALAPNIYYQMCA